MGNQEAFVSILSCGWVRLGQDSLVFRRQAARGQTGGGVGLRCAQSNLRARSDLCMLPSAKADSSGCALGM